MLLVLCLHILLRYVELVYLTIEVSCEINYELDTILSTTSIRQLYRFEVTSLWKTNIQRLTLEEQSRHLPGFKYTNFDFSTEHLQLPMKPLTAFVTIVISYWSYRLVNKCARCFLKNDCQLLFTKIRLYLDDILILNMTINGTLAILHEVLNIFKNNGLRTHHNVIHVFFSEDHYRVFKFSNWA